MPETKTYGVICNTCKRWFPIGEVELEKGAQLADLRDKLAGENWKPRVVTCPRPKCNAATLAELRKLLFPGDPETRRGLRAWLRRMGVLRS